MTLGAPFTLATANGAAAADLEKLVALLPHAARLSVALWFLRRRGSPHVWVWLHCLRGAARRPAGLSCHAGCSASFTMSSL